ncbi:LPXTG-motif cell wall anchor domain-containing protein [Amycolatopsis xylanica]|uniref:LPXTG-motif cell wall anchor domain-containing protein n=1 Tax=Amycolatopsis xylanica TaxID=589385 RepID=A0A1H3DPU3_9PSEU|nr:LPXTG cell wall anchor domain-containing protein [Amycolatopsis xylanica]SDX67679.1 LPXTG-motif cell wall anchor domain-containing protein [Amycolatopsis xylanica]
MKSKTMVGASAALLTMLLLTSPAWADQGGNPNANAQDHAKHSKSTPDTNSPQPPSGADFSGHGANTHGPYDSTRDGSASANGNGGGQANGKPCAGCVGKADNKNPHGQLPGGSDANAGYECDTNHGVGRGNPAHTGCTPGETPPGKTPPGDTPPGGRPPAGPETPAMVVAAVAPADVATERAQSLAHTGFDLELPLLTGLGLLGAGGAALVAVRRRRQGS